MNYLIFRAPIFQPVSDDIENPFLANTEDMTRGYRKLRPFYETVRLSRVIRPTGHPEITVDLGGEQVTSSEQFSELLAMCDNLEPTETPDGTQVAKGVVCPWKINNRTGAALPEGHAQRLLPHESSNYLKHVGAMRRRADRMELTRQPVGESMNKRAKERQKRLLGKDLGSLRALNTKDMDVLQFLAKVPYASVQQLANINHLKYSATRNRMTKLSDHNLVQSVPMWSGCVVWVATQEGIDVAGYVRKPTTKKDISYALMAHTFVVNHVASNLFGGGVNVLKLPDFPQMNRKDSWGRETYGEEFVSELEIRSSLGGLKSGAGRNSKLQPLINQALERTTDEMAWGNEFLWALYPDNKVFHLPDLVLKRPRTSSPHSIAVEVEMNHKADYSSTHTSYLQDMDRVYERVVWVCRTRGIAKAVEKSAREVGLWNTGKISIVPIFTDEGVFNSRDVWSL